MKQTATIQTIIAFFGFFIGYPYLGSIFIVLMVPFILYMVAKRDAVFLPALMIHCASSTSIIYLVGLSMMITCIFNFKLFTNNKTTRFLFLSLLMSLPIYIVLTIQRIQMDGDTWQEALHYTSYYLSFWTFLFCCYISSTFNKKVAKQIVVILSIFAGMCILFNVTPRLMFAVVISGIVLSFWYIKDTNLILQGSIYFVVCFTYLFVFSTLTFTLLLTLIYALLISIFWKGGKVKIIKKFTRVWPYVVILIIMIVGVNNYSSTSFELIGDTAVGFEDMEHLSNNAKAKLFSDRAPFWMAGWNQLLLLKPILPIHDIPNFEAFRSDGRTVENVTFGAHNTPLQLLRLFGFIMGGLLIVCYIKCTSLASRYFVSKSVDLWSLSIISVSFSYSIVLFLTGTASMLLDLCLFTFGLMGIACGLAEDSKSKFLLNRLKNEQKKVSINS